MEPNFAVFHPSQMLSLFSDLLQLFFPEVCLACTTGLNRGEKVICLDCHLSLPCTRFHEQPNNPAERQLLGLCSGVPVAALWYFNKSSRVQKLIHNLKYAGHTEAGILAGHLLGQQLRTSSRFNGLVGIIPVPLHQTKMLKRGYNQSESFGKGLSEVLQIPMHSDWLQRVSASTSQTRRNRRNRHEAVENAFVVNRSLVRPGRYLLVDDVITTGATLVSCISALAAVDGVEVSAATMAFARR